MRFLVLRINQERYVPERLKEEAGKKGNRLDIFHYQDLSFQFTPDLKILVKERDVLEYDRVIFRVAGTTSGSYIAYRDRLIEYLLKNNKLCLNGQSYLKFSRLDKLTQHFYLSRAGLPVVKTFCFGKNTPFEQLKERLFEQIGLPIIAKPRFGAQGKNIFLLKKEGELKRLYQEIREEKKNDLSLWLFQEFLPAGFDYRVIVLGDKVLGAMKKGEFLTNFSRGGRVYKEEITKKQESLALRAASLFSLEYAGVDIMIGPGGRSYLLEVNRACQFKGFEQSTGINVAAKIINLLQGGSQTE